MSTVGENVRRLRFAAGFAHQGKFAERAGVLQQWLSDLENDRYLMPDTGSLMKLATAIGCGVEDLLAGVDPNYDQTRVEQALRALSDFQENEEAIEDFERTITPEAARTIAAIKYLKGRSEELLGLYHYHLKDSRLFGDTNHHDALTAYRRDLLKDWFDLPLDQREPLRELVRSSAALARRVNGLQSPEQKEPLNEGKEPGGSAKSGNRR